MWLSMYNLSQSSLPYILHVPHRCPYCSLTVVAIRHRLCWISNPNGRPYNSDVTGNITARTVGIAGYIQWESSRRRCSIYHWTWYALSSVESTAAALAYQSSVLLRPLTFALVNDLSIHLVKWLSSSIRQRSLITNTNTSSLISNSSVVTVSERS